jgi:hypothetical protein
MVFSYSTKRNGSWCNAIALENEQRVFQFNDILVNSLYKCDWINYAGVSCLANHGNAKTIQCLPFPFEVW